MQPVYTMLDNARAAARWPSCCGAWRPARSNGSPTQTERIPATVTRTELAAEMRYDGQGYDVTVPLDRAWLADGDIGSISDGVPRRASRDLRPRQRGGADLAEGTARACGGRNAEAAPCAAPSRPQQRPARRHAPIRLFGRTLRPPRSSSAPQLRGRRVAGPAIINQMDTTTLVPPGWQARRIDAGALVLERIAPKEGAAP